MKLYEALYCGCIHESSYATLSIHKTRRGAGKAAREHRAKEYEKWLRHREWQKKEYDKKIFESKEFQHTHRFGVHETWAENEIEVQE